MTKRTPLSNKRTTIPNGRTKLTNARYSSSDVRGGAVDQTGPQWKSESWDIEWTTGDTIDYDVRQHLEPGNDILHYTFERTSGTFPLDLEMNNGIITGTISAVQGGTYPLTVLATNPIDNSSSSDDLSIAIVGLEITEPTFANLPDYNTVEEGASLTLFVSDSAYLTDDGDPASVQTITYTVDAGSTDQLPDGITLESFGLMWGAYAEGSIGTYNVTIKATNEEELSDTDIMQFVVVDNAVAAPTVTAIWGGPVSCGALAPVWDTVPSLSFEDDEVTTYDLNAHVNQGSSAITTWADVGANLPSGITLGTTTGILAVDGNQLVAAAVAITISAQNTTGTNSSDAFNLTVTAFATPTITSIEALDSTSSLIVNFSEAVTSSGSYTDGFTFTINGVSDGLTIASGQGTNQLIYTTDTAMTGNNTLNLVYADTGGLLYSDTNGSGYQVADTGVGGETFVVPVASAISSVIGTISEGSTLTINGGGFGVKATPEPFKWDNFEDGGDLGQSISTDTSTPRWTGRSDAFNAPHVYNDTRSYGGTRCALVEHDGVGDFFSGSGIKGLAGEEIYITFYCYFTATVLRIIKYLRINSTPDFYYADTSSPSCWITSHTGIENTFAIVNSERTEYVHIENSNPATKLPMGSWNKVEMHFKLSNPAGAANGECSVTLNCGDFYADLDDTYSPVPSTYITRTSAEAGKLIDNFLLPAMDDLVGDFQAWIDNVYVDSTRMRVEVGNQPTWAACTQRDPQPASLWADGQITVEANLPQYTTGNTVYFYVMDSNNNPVTTAGFPKTVA